MKTILPVLAALVLLASFAGAAAPRAAQPNSIRARAYPTTFQPDLGHDRITFTALPEKAVVTIYTISGEKIRVLNKDDAGSDQLVWTPVLSERGSAPASGVYLYTIATPGEPLKRGKLLIIR